MPRELLSRACSNDSAPKERRRRERTRGKSRSIIQVPFLTELLGFRSFQKLGQ
jgi:hypothetical protein